MKKVENAIMQVTLINSNIFIKHIDCTTPNDIRRMIEYLEACGPATFYNIQLDLCIVGSAVIDHLASARALGLIKLVDGKYPLTSST
jgi:hypothetical protein